MRVKISAQLRKAIETSGMSRYEISKLTGIEQSRLSRFISGGNLTMDQIDTICKLLKLTLKKDR